MLLDVARSPVMFCAKMHPHSSRPFTGRRVVLALFSLQGTQHLGADDLSSLHVLSFPLPSCAQLDSSEVVMPSALHLEGSALHLLPSSVVGTASQHGPTSGCNSLTRQGPDVAPLAPAKQPRLAPDLKRQAPLLVEICVGSAILSSSALASGWDSVPIDQVSCRFSPHTPLVTLDLREAESIEILLNFDSASSVDWYHLGLPCGTCSRAREKPLPGGQGARPLRGPDAIFGFEGLRPFEA